MGARRNGLGGLATEFTPGAPFGGVSFAGGVGGDVESLDGLARTNLFGDFPIDVLRAVARRLPGLLWCLLYWHCSYTFAGSDLDMSDLGTLFGVVGLAGRIGRTSTRRGLREGISPRT